MRVYVRWNHFLLVRSLQFVYRGPYNMQRPKSEASTMSCFVLFPTIFHILVVSSLDPKAYVPIVSQLNFNSLAA